MTGSPFMGALRGGTLMPIKIFKSSLSTVGFLFILTATFLQSDCGRPIKNLRNPEIIARINGYEIPAAAFEALDKSLRLRPEYPGREALLKSMIVHRLLAEHFRERRTSAEQASTPGAESGKIPDLENSEFARELREFLKYTGNSEVYRRRLEAMRSTRPAPTIKRSDLKAMFARPGTGPLVFADTSRTSQNPGSPVLARYRLPGGELLEIDLSTLYKYQNPQGQAEMRAGNTAFVRRAARTLALEKYLLYVKNHSEDKFLRGLADFIKDKTLARNYLVSLGLSENIHADSVILRRRALNVSSAKVRQYYEKNRENFREVRSVSCRHIRVASEKKAGEIYKNLLKSEGGLEFNRAIRRYSIAPDAKSKSPGQLPEIQNPPATNAPFVHRLCLLQKQGRVSPPLRSPGAKTSVYEILLVDKRVEGYRAITEISLRDEIARNIARQEIKEELWRLREKLIQAADFSVNWDLLGVDLKLEWKREI